MLHVEAPEVRRMIRQDGLPAVMLPTAVRRVERVCPRLLFAWLRERAVGRFFSWEEWLVEVAAARGVRAVGEDAADAGTAEGGAA
jgi:hypothetical protein